MDCFEYPIDTRTLLRKKNKILKELYTSNKTFIKKRIAVLGGSTTNEIVDQLRLFLLNYGIDSSFYQSEYGKYWEDAMFENKELENFKPDLIYIHTNWRNISIFPQISDSKNRIDRILEEEFIKFQTMWDRIYLRFDCPIIQNNFERPNYRLLGNKDISDIHGRSNYISRLNQKIYEYAECHPNFYINDIEYLAADYGVTKWSDTIYWHMYKYALALDAIPILASNIAKIIKAIYGKNKKVLTLDLDNTLWGGIIGDDGVEGIAIGSEIPKGEIYSEFQIYCKSLKSIGVILTIDSKNDKKNAIAGLNHPEGILKPDDFVTIKANWNPKNVNIENTAKELSLGLDSFVFIDDNPAEREIVKKQIVDVSVPNVENVDQYIKVLDHEGYFEVVALSEEDLNKTELYKAKAKASILQSSFNNYDEYLKDMNMVAIIKKFEPIYYQRISQLTNKSNQFNLTTLRCSEEDIRKMSEDPKYITFYGKLKDKFADNGIVTVMVGECKGKELHIRLWLMSCRVLKRGLEDVMMNEAVKEAKKGGIDVIKGYYYPTPKNAMVKELFAKYGFECVDEVNNGSTWLLNVNQYKEKTVNIEVIDRS